MAFVVDVSLHILASSLIANTITSRASATLNACARALKRAGAARVDALTLARVVKPASGDI